MAETDMPDPTDIENKLALLAHDLRTPLSAMRLTAELIGTEDLSDGQRSYLQVLLRSIDILTVMTSELVNAASRAQTVTEDARVEVAGILQDQADLFRVAAEQKGLKLTFELDASGAGWSVERAGNLSRAVATLLDNAIKYTDSGGVTLKASPCVSGSNVSHTLFQISVTDTGPGVQDGEAEHIFRPFVRGRAGETCRQGSGLGLWGASELLQEMGGELRVSPCKEGGSRFVITLPVQRSVDGPLETDAEVEVLQAVPTGPINAHVLVVDDNHTNRRLLVALLESFGASSVTVASGQEALDVLQEEAFDVILLDLHMPALSGEDSVQLWRGVIGEALPPIVAVTAASDTVDLGLLKAKGFCQLLAKPLSPAEFYRILSDVLPKPYGD